jgi:hypothetical protein
MALSRWFRVTLLRALVRNVGTCRPDAGEISKWKHLEDPSTDAARRDGVACSGEEGAVLALERRRDTVQLYRKVNRHAGGTFG